MSSASLLAAAAAVAIFIVPALAFGQAQTPQDQMPQNPAPQTQMATPGQGAMIPPMTATPQDSAPSAQGASMNTSGVRVDASQLPPDQARALAQGDNTLVTNGPVPDTPANRAKYRPLSHAGKKSPPAGN